jgi:hypothetical protein
MQKNRGEILPLASNDVRRASDSLIHEGIILDMGLRCVDPGFSAPLYDMYVHLKAGLLLPATIGTRQIPLIDCAIELSPRGSPMLPVKKSKAGWYYFTDCI